MGFIKPFIIEDLEDIPQTDSSESEDDAPPVPVRVHHMQRRLRVIHPLKDDWFPLRSKVGKKRAKRQENNFHLIALGADECPDIPENLIQSRGSRFAQLMKNDSAMQIWTVFMNASEDIQNEILENQIFQASRCLNIVEDKHISPEEALLNMSYEERKFFIKSNLPLGLLVFLENEVIKFFIETPSGIYTAHELSSYERKILHGIAIYYRLESKSDTCKMTNSRYVVLYNTKRKFVMPSALLSEYLAEKKVKKIQGLAII